MSKGPIEMVKEAIKHYEDSQLRLESVIVGLQKSTKVAEQELIDMKALKQQFEAALECLWKAKELEEKEDEKSDEGGG